MDSQDTGSFGSESESQGPEDLYWLLGHEVRAAARYRRFVSVVMVASDVAGMEAGRFLKGQIRESDELFDMGDYATVLMTDTDQFGAQVAVRRFEGMAGTGGGMRFAVGTFPDDGQRAPDLVEAAYRRLRGSDGGDAGTTAAHGAE